MSYKKIENIIIKENQNTNQIFLWEIGRFYRVYEYSAFQIKKHLWDLRINTTVLKNTETEERQNIVFGGIPKDSLDKLLKIAKKRNRQFEQNEKYLRFWSFTPINKEEFDLWKRGLIYPINRNSIKNKIAEYKFISKKIKKFSTKEKTPWESVQFLLELQNTIKILDKERK